MFYLKYRTNKHIIDLAILLFVGLLLVTGCDKQSTPPSEESEIEEPTCEKDGIISIVLHQDIEDSTDSFSRQLIDTLFISEIEDSIWIRNAYTFSMPRSQSFSLFFTGELQDMPEYVAIWYKYARYNNIYKKKQLRSELSLLGPNHGITKISNIDSEYSDQDSVKGYVFFLDFDNVHSGNGQLTLKNGAFKKILPLTVEEHTVILDSRIKTLDFKIADNAVNIDILSSDYESFIQLEFNAIWLLQYKNQPDSFYRWAPASEGNTICLDGENREFRILGFAPNFIQ